MSACLSPYVEHHLVTMAINEAVNEETKLLISANHQCINSQVVKMCWSHSAGQRGDEGGGVERSLSNGRGLRGSPNLLP